MCGGLQINRVNVRPGDSIKYRTLKGSKEGIWGLGHGVGAYNARVENLHKTWSRMKNNRAVVEVDSFDEKGSSFKRPDGPTLLAALYDISDDIVIITMPSCGGIEKIHHRQPIVLLNGDDWLKDGDLSTNWAEGFTVITRTAPRSNPRPSWRQRFLEALSVMILAIFLTSCHNFNELTPDTRYEKIGVRSVLDIKCLDSSKLILGEYQIVRNDSTNKYAIAHWRIGNNPMNGYKFTSLTQLTYYNETHRLVEVMPMFNTGESTFPDSASCLRAIDSTHIMQLVDDSLLKIKELQEQQERKRHIYH